MRPKKDRIQPNKEFYTKAFLNALGKPVTDENYKELFKKLWYGNSVKPQGGLRLTDEGLQFIKKELQIEVYEIPFPNYLDIKPQVIIHMDRFITCPYHYTTKKITVIKSSTAVELFLFSGDVKLYGLNKAISNTSKSRLF